MRRAYYPSPSQWLKTGQLLPGPIFATQYVTVGVDFGRLREPPLRFSPNMMPVRAALLLTDSIGSNPSCPQTAMERGHTASAMRT